ncbi:MAG: OmpA family protein [Bacteroides sp.]|nr:OmpA family protein [Bacteroides sp.]
MNVKFLTIAILLAGTAVTANAQETKTKYYTEKATDNIFVGVGIGGMSVLNGGLNTPTFNFNIQVGKYITPTWGVRGEIGGLWQSLDDQEHGYFVSGSSRYHSYCKKFVELNLDAMLNLTNWLGGYNPDRLVDFYLFGGPTINWASKGTSFTGGVSENDEYLLENNKDKKLRFGATAGLGLGFNLSSYLALGLEARFGVTPSIFGDASDCRKAEATGRLNLNLTYTFGGKKFVSCDDKIDQVAINEEVNKYRNELAAAQADLANTKNALANVKPEVREVTKEVQVAGPRAIFFKIGSAQIDDYGKVNIRLAAKVLKANPDKKYRIAGYADKATGSVSLNQKLSEKRAQAVYDAFIAEGVKDDQLEIVGFGGTENMFGKNYLNRVVIME